MSLEHHCDFSLKYLFFCFLWVSLVSFSVHIRVYVEEVFPWEKKNVCQNSGTCQRKVQCICDLV